MVDEKSTTDRAMARKNQIKELTATAGISRQQTSLSMTKLLNQSQLNSVFASTNQDIENHGADATESYDSDEEEKRRVKEEKRHIKAEKAEKKRLYWKAKNQKFIRIMKKMTCFQDYKQEFNDDDKIPSCK